ncbi:MAG: glycosyltransferase [Bryobacterales bacterium]|nr:glycosyltransferase [Bryobacterales bacterium]
MAPVPILLTVRELDQGGCERDLTKLALHIDRSRFEPHVACFLPDGIRGEELSRAGIPVKALPVRSFRSYSALAGAAAMRRYLRAHGIQLMQAFDVPLSVFSAPVGRWAGTPVVLTSQLSFRHLAGPMMHRLTQWSDRLADGVVVNCQAMQRHVTADEGVREDRVHLCYNGIDTALFQPRPRRRLPFFPETSLVVGEVCALRPEKGLVTLLEGFALAVRREPGLRLLLVGSGAMRERLEAEAQRLAIRELCHFEPAVSDVASWLQAIDIFVLPSLSEALSNGLMEAMACGCACIASEVGGNPELIREGETGLLFPAADAEALAARITQLTGNPQLRRTLGEAASASIRRDFSLAAYTRRMEELYTAQLAAKAARGGDRGKR